MAHDLEFAFESLIHWDISTISTDIATCLSNFPAAAMSESGVGILACSTLQRLVSPYVKDSMSKHARLLVEISLALRNNGKVARYAGYTTEELRHLRSFAGTRAIQGLEAALRNPFDNSLLGDQGRALFLTLFSVIVAVANYSLKPVSPLGVIPYYLLPHITLLTCPHSLINQPQPLRDLSLSRNNSSVFSLIT